MDWIERLFHISPDGGSGSLELGIFVAAAAAIAMVLVGALKKYIPGARGWPRGLLGRNQRTPSSSLDRSDA